MDYILPNPFEYVDQPNIDHECELSPITYKILENHTHPLPHDLLLIKDPLQNKLDPNHHHGHFMGQRKIDSSSQPKRKSIISFGEVDNGDQHPDQEEGKKVKKMMHRDVERQRRQEMTTLYASLRSHLPLQYLKGKRSISDHVHQVADYIKHLQKNIEELRGKKAQLLKEEGKISGSSSTSRAVVENLHTCSRMGDSVILVSPVSTGGGVELVVNTPALEQGLPLSKVISIMVAQGLSIESCNSAKRNQRFIYTLQSEVIDGQNIDIPELRNILNSVFGSAKPSFKPSTNEGA